MQPSEPTPVLEARADPEGGATSELHWLSAEALRAALVRRELSAAEVVEHFLARADALDPTLHVYAELDREGARAQARAADAALRAGERPGPLHGIPTAIKDHIAVAGLRGHQTGDAPAPVAPADSFPVARLRAAGAIILGTNSMLGSGGGGALAGEGIFAPFNWEAEARSPWDTRRVPGWSSSGGAAAVAAGILPFAIGSDGGGSTRLPAAYCGVVGMHPTGGLIADVDYARPRPPAGITVGPLAREVRDAALVTQVMAGPDGRDPFCIDDEPDDFLAHIEDGVVGMRLAWTDDFGFARRYAAAESERVIALGRAAAQRLTGLGARVDETREVWDDIMPGRMAQWLAYYPTPGLALPPPEVMRAGFEARGRNWDRFRALFGTHDLILSVTSQRVTQPIAEWEAAWTSEGPSYPGGSFLGSYCSHTDMFNWLRFPAISVPCGFVDGFPVGLQIAGPRGSEAKIFRAAQAFQAAFPQPERPPVS